MTKRGLIQCQKVVPEKLERAKELRQNQTPAEATIWAELRRNRLGGFHFRRQQVIDGFIVDFYCHRVGLVIEIDGPIHQSNRDYDKNREKVLKDRELCILRFTNQEVIEQLDDVKTSILAACERLSSEIDNFTGENN